MRYTFEDYLMEQYIRIENPCKDCAVEGYEEWVVDLESELLIAYSNSFALKHSIKAIEGIKEVYNG